MSETHDVASALAEFAGQVKEHPGVKKLLDGWEPNVVVSPVDSDDEYTLLVRGSLITEILAERREIDHMLEVEAPANVLIEVFTRGMNPAKAFLDGELFIFGDEADQIKLDALSLLIWGM